MLYVSNMANYPLGSYVTKRILCSKWVTMHVRMCMSVL